MITMEVGQARFKSGHVTVNALGRLYRSARAGGGGRYDLAGEIDGGKAMANVCRREGCLDMGVFRGSDG